MKNRGLQEFIFLAANIHLGLEFLLEDMVSYPQYITLEVGEKAALAAGIKTLHKPNGNGIRQQPDRKN